MELGALWITGIVVSGLATLVSLSSLAFAIYFNKGKMNAKLRKFDVQVGSLHIAVSRNMTPEEIGKRVLQAANAR